MKLYVKKVKNVKGEVKETLWVRFYDHHRKLIRKPLKLSNTKANRKLAETQLIPQLMLKLHSGEFFNKTAPTLNEYMRTSFEMNKSRRRATTQNDYQISYDKHIEPHLGHMKLDKIKASDLELWQNKVLESVSPRRLKNIRAVLSGILNDAYRDELISKNPLTLVKTIKAEKVEIHPFSLSEISEILENSEGQDRNFFALAFFTGMRSGEMIGLKWCDIDFKKMEIHIQRSRKMGVNTPPKTESSNRVIDILDSLYVYLQSQYKLTGDKNSYVFLNEGDEPIYDIKRIRDRAWKKTLKVCELEYRPIYHTRHTFATVMLENGEDILWVSNMLGHTDSTMTLSRYARYVKRKERKRGQFLQQELALKDTELTPSNNYVA
ncbi:site-specific integrase [Sulfurimonas sp. HSL3-7]|uniref:tyrosine-type recombinase/integrase n=1 Tax=Sulfonitrofixus jiaomeiensis TaxID=3131938 RepID=UPI0031F73AE2